MKNDKGLTLVELLIAIVILTIVMALIATILVQTFNIFSNSTERVSKDRLIQIMIEDLSQNIREGHYFDFRNNNTWIFYSAKDSEGNLIENFRIENSNDKLSIVKDGSEVRVLEGVNKFKLSSYATDSDDNQIFYYDGSAANLNSFIFEFELEVNLGNNNMISEQKFVYSRNL